ncbi:competence type IV pilus minor pilin ComGD [Mesobacillus subterraneus]|uniref:Prepilin-type N-terminal cleavage/methylation domain-containing protein n=1 Tax=Mesobacillus subterraneus TaxID=285983 RepID=A0A3R9E6S9_9BACI|nr:competence type IV pilus minor pilin ComGD [Mesobacillus subterraneus]RSD27424.1 prepilin-type N-terminal cleavage/methylation domain-containing protein [Mesobacillus subterraneus]
MNHSAGFTMVEMLIVLSAFLMLSLTSAFLFSPHDENLQKQLFFSQFETDLLYGQQYAISHQEQITVHIVPEENYYYIRGGDYKAPHLIKRSFPKGIEVRKGTMNLLFHYMPDGNTDSFGSILVKVGSRTYKMMILIGKGRFYVTEE